MRGFSLVAASGGHSSSRCTGLSLSRPLLLRSTGSRRAGSVIVAHGPSCSAGCGIFPDQRSNPCPLHWQADSQPLRHQGSPLRIIFDFLYLLAKLSLKIANIKISSIRSKFFILISPLPIIAKRVSFTLFLLCFKESTTAKVSLVFFLMKDIFLF